MTKNPGNGDGSKIITLPTAQEHGFCHRSAGGQIVMTAPGGQAAIIGGGQPQPANVGTWQPCVGKMCHYWDEAAEQCMDRTHVDLIADQVEALREIRDAVTPPNGERRPLPVEITDVKAILELGRNILDTLKARMK